MAKRKYTRFVKPKPEQVKEYGLSIGFPIDGEEFCDFYEAKGWKIGNSPMKNWEACVRTWKRNWQKRTGRTNIIKPVTEGLKTANQLIEEIEGERHA
jgi:hypothetical protein